MEGQSSLKKQAKFSKRILFSSQGTLQYAMPNEHPVNWLLYHHFPTMENCHQPICHHSVIKVHPRYKDVRMNNL